MKLDELIGRRSELLAELFLQDLGPKFVARPSTDFGFDFFVGFQNSRGGVNLVTVEVKSKQTTEPTQQLKASTYNLLANSNVPGLVLVIDVKSNKVLYHLVPPAGVVKRQSVTVPLIEVDDAQREYLKRLFSSEEGAP